MSRSGEELTALAYERLDAIAEAEYLEDAEGLEVAIDPSDPELMGVIAWAALLRIRWRIGFVNDAWTFDEHPTIRIASIANDPHVRLQQEHAVETLINNPEEPDYFAFQGFLEEFDWDEKVTLVRDLIATEQAMPGHVEYRAMINGRGSLDQPSDSSPTGYVLEDDDWLLALEALCRSVAELARSGDERAWDVFNTASSHERRMIALELMKYAVGSWMFHAPSPGDEIGPHIQSLKPSPDSGVEAAEADNAVVEMLTKAADGKPDEALAVLGKHVPAAQRTILHHLAALRFCDGDHHQDDEA